MSFIERFHCTITSELYKGQFPRSQCVLYKVPLLINLQNNSAGVHVHNLVSADETNCPVKLCQRQSTFYHRTSKPVNNTNNTKISCSDAEEDDLK